MLSTILAGLMGYYAGLYTYLWSQLYSPQRRIKDKVASNDYLKYKQL